MEVPASCRHVHSIRLTTLAVALPCFLLAACATGTSQLDRPGRVARAHPFSQGRVTVVLVDEYGIALPGMRVDMSWQEPYFYKTSATTNRQGEVTFSSVPEVAEVSVDYPGGQFVRTLIVPQTGRPEFRALIDTRGTSELLRQRELSRLQR